MTTLFVHNHVADLGRRKGALNEELLVGRVVDHVDVLAAEFADDAMDT